MSIALTVDASMPHRLHDPGPRGVSPRARSLDLAVARLADRVHAEGDQPGRDDTEEPGAVVGLEDLRQGAVEADRLVGVELVRRLEEEQPISAKTTARATWPTVPIRVIHVFTAGCICSVLSSSRNSGAGP